MFNQCAMTPMTRIGVVFAALLLGVAACSTESGMIDELPVFDGATAVAQSDCADACAALTETFSQWLRGSYEIIGERDFAVSEKQVEWVAIRKFVDNALGPHCQLQQPDWYRPGYDLFAIWKCGGLLRTQYVGLAFSNMTDVSGRRVLAYYELKPTR